MTRPALARTWIKDPLMRSLMEDLFQALLEEKQGRKIDSARLARIIEHEEYLDAAFEEEMPKRFKSLEILVDKVLAQLLPGVDANKLKRDWYEIDGMPYREIHFSQIPFSPISHVCYGLKPIASSIEKIESYLSGLGRNPDDVAGRFLFVMKDERALHTPTEAGALGNPALFSENERTNYARRFTSAWKRYAARFNLSNKKKVLASVTTLASNIHPGYRVVTRQPYEMLYNKKRLLYFSQKFVKVGTVEKDLANMPDAHVFMFDDASAAFDFYQNARKTIFKTEEPVYREGWTKGIDANSIDNVLAIEGNTVVNIGDPTNSGENIDMARLVLEKYIGSGDQRTIHWRSGSQEVREAQAAGYARQKLADWKSQGASVHQLGGSESYHISQRDYDLLIQRIGDRVTTCWKPRKGNPNAFLKWAKKAAKGALRQQNSKDISDLVSQHILHNTDLGGMKGTWFLYPNVIDEVAVDNKFHALRDQTQKVARRMKNYFLKPRDDGYAHHIGMSFLHGWFFEGQFITPYHWIDREVLEPKFSIRHTGKSTGVRKLSSMIPEHWKLQYCRYRFEEVYQKSRGQGSFDRLSDLLTTDRYFIFAQKTSKRDNFFPLLETMIELPISDMIGSGDIAKLSRHQVDVLGEQLTTVVTALASEYQQRDVRPLLEKINKLPAAWLEKANHEMEIQNGKTWISNYQIKMTGLMRQFYPGLDYSKFYEQISGLVPTTVDLDFSKPHTQIHLTIKLSRLLDYLGQKAASDPVEDVACKAVTYGLARLATELPKQCDDTTIGEGLEKVLNSPLGLTNYIIPKYFMAAEPSRQLLQAAQSQNGNELVLDPRYKAFANTSSGDQPVHNLLGMVPSGTELKTKIHHPKKRVEEMEWANRLLHIGLSHYDLEFVQEQALMFLATLELHNKHNLYTNLGRLK